MRILLTLPILLILHSCGEEASKEELPSPFSFTIVSGELPTPPERFRTVSEKIYALIEQDQTQTFEPYTETIPLSNETTFNLIPIPGGTFLMGSSTDDPNHKPDELPARRVQLDSFWMASTETTWAMYQRFLNQKDGKGFYIGRDEFGYPLEPISDQPIDMISGPSSPYTPEQSGPVSGLTTSSSYQQPATGVSRHAALKFCQWLSAQTGHFYRLPTEAEWEYACRAGTTTAYSFGDDQASLPEFGRAYQIDLNAPHSSPVAQRNPNPWGLYDMHGNVSEWTLDAYLPDRQKLPDLVKNPISFSPKLHQGVARGGNFDHDPEDLRSAARFPASREWNAQDPQAPPSIWYNSSASWLGFRIVRPLKTPSLDEAHLIWNIDSGKFWNW